MVTRYIDAQTVGQEHGKGAEALRVFHSDIFQASSPAGCETVTQVLGRVEVDSQLREAAVNVGVIPDANADFTLYVYRNQQRLQLSAIQVLDNLGDDACDPTPRVPFVFDVTGQLNDQANCRSLPQMLAFLQTNLTCCDRRTVRVQFSTPVYNANNETGALVAADFTFVDTSVGGFTLTTVTHTAGDDFATLLFSGAVVSTRAAADYDLTALADTLAPAGCQIFGPSLAANVGLAMPTTPVQPISGDTARAVFPFGPDVLMKGDFLYAETVRDTCSTLQAAWSVEVGWMPFIFGHGSDYKTYIG